MLQFKTYNPALANLYIAALKINSKEILCELKQLFSELLQKYNNVFMLQSEENLNVISEECFNKRVKEVTKELGVPNEQFGEFYYSGSFFPGHRIYRVLPVAEKNAVPKNMEEKCNKYAKGPGKAAPGLLVFSCLEHGKIIGVYVLEKHESPSIVARILLQRFNKIPDIMYDNACNLSEYMLNW